MDPLIPFSLNIPTNLQSLRDELISKKSVIVDIRELNEWQQGHLDCALSWPLSAIERLSMSERAQWLQNFHGRHLYFHCQSGRRVHYAFRLLSTLHPHLYLLEYNPQQLTMLIPELQLCGSLSRPCSSTENS